jgi:hypothetical protein
MLTGAALTGTFATDNQDQLVGSLADLIRVSIEAV